MAKDSKLDTTTKYRMKAGGRNTGKVFTQTRKMNCDICGKQQLDEYVDGVTKMGPWGNMCMKCFRRYGLGLGVGLGQHYVRVEDGEAV